MPEAINPVFFVPRAVRTEHLNFDAACEAGGPVTSAQLASFLGVTAPDGVEPLNICGNPNCGNPQHYAWLGEGERRSTINQAKRNRVIALLRNEEFAQSSVNYIARLAGVSRTLVRNVLEDEGIDRGDTLVGQDGREYAARHQKKQ